MGGDKEVALARFRLSLKYEATSAEEIVEIEAETVSSAKRMCEEMIAENRDLAERLERFNVWTSRRLSSCVLCPYDYRLDFLGCDLILKNNV